MPKILGVMYFFFSIKPFPLSHYLNFSQDFSYIYIRLKFLHHFLSKEKSIDDAYQSFKLSLHCQKEHRGTPKWCIKLGFCHHTAVFFQMTNDIITIFTDNRISSDTVKQLRQFGKRRKDTMGPVKCSNGNHRLQQPYHQKFLKQYYLRHRYSML